MNDLTFRAYSISLLPYVDATYLNLSFKASQLVIRIYSHTPNLCLNMRSFIDHNSCAIIRLILLHTFLRLLKGCQRYIFSCTYAYAHVNTCTFYRLIHWFLELLMCHYRFDIIQYVLHIFPHLYNKEIYQLYIYIYIYSYMYAKCKCTCIYLYTLLCIDG